MLRACEHRCHGRIRRGGFTLVELLIVLMILSIVLSVALPAVAGATRATRLETARNTLIGDLRLARTEAIRRNRSVEIQKTSATTYSIQYVGARTLPEGATFTSGPDLVRFAAFGPVQTGGATYTLSAGGRSAKVVLSPSGNASAQ